MQNESISWESVTWPPLFMPELNAEFDGGQTPNPENLAMGSPVLAARMDDLVQSLANTHESMPPPNAAADKPPFNFALAKTVFTLENLDYLTSVYFRRVHAAHPILHKPTFDLETASLPVLLIIFCFGSLYSAPVDSALSIRSFFDVAEEFVFSHPAFLGLLNRERSSQDPPLSAEDLGILQAALSVIIVQNSINDKPTRRRIQYERNPRFSAALRFSGVLEARHEAVNETVSAALRWEKFIRDEMRIRCVR